MIETFAEARAVMAPTGELLIALPIYANETGALFEGSDMEKMGLNKTMSIGMYQQFGYLMYHPSQEVSFYMQTLDLFTDLGVL
jgi:hypothetical protein